MPVQPNIMEWGEFKQLDYRSRKQGSPCFLFSSSSCYDHVEGWVRKLQRPSSTTYSSILRQCISLRALKLGRQVHQHMIAHNYDRGCFLGNLLLQMYVSCGGSAEDAESVFSRIHDPETFSWNMAMAAYAYNGRLKDASRWFLETIRQRNVVSWTILMTAYAQAGNPDQALQMFFKMAQWNVVASTSMIKVLAELRDLRGARKMFEEMAERSYISWNTMIIIYAQCGRLEAAESVLEKSPAWDVVPLTTLLTAYAQSADLTNSVKMFQMMRFRTEAPWNAMIKACCVAAADRAKFLFERIPMRDVITSTTMVDAYAQIGDLESARAVFDEMPERNSVTWGVMISAYSKDDGAESLRLFLRMEIEGFRVEAMTYVAVLDACGSVPAIAQGRIVHDNIQERGLQSDLRIGSALVNMYGKCGQLRLAREVFEDIPVQDVILWTSLIVSYARNGLKGEAMAAFGEMQLEGFNPDSVTFVSVLSAWSHSGVKSDWWFAVLGLTWDDYGVKLSAAHYLCVLDVLRRAGQLEEAEEVIDCMPYEPGVVAWTTLLSGSKEIGDVRRAAGAAERLQMLDPGQRAPYTLLPNMFASSQMG